MPLSPEQVEDRLKALEDRNTKLETLLGSGRAFTNNPLALATDLDDLGSVKTHLDFEEPTLAPVDPPADVARLKAKDLSAETGLFYVDSAGNEFWLADSIFRNMPLTSVSGDWTTAVSGTGTTSLHPRRINTSTGGATGAARISESLTFIGITQGSTRGVLDWDRRILIKVRFTIPNGGASATSRIGLGKENTNGTGDPDDKYVGISVTALGLNGQVHNGTDLVTTASLFTLTANQVYDLLIISRGDGNVEWFIDGVSKGTSTGGPVGDSTSAHTAFRVESVASSAATHSCQVFSYSYADIIKT